MNFLNGLYNDYISPYFHAPAPSEQPQPEAPQAPEVPNVQNNEKIHVEDPILDSDDEEDAPIDPNAGQNQAPQQDASGWSPYKPLPASAPLGTHFDFLRKDAMYTVEQKMVQELAKLRTIETESNLVDQLVSRVIAKCDEQKAVSGINGGFDCTDDLELTQLLKNARALDIDIPAGTKFTKDQKDLILKKLERKAKDFERKIKESAQAVERAKTNCDRMYEILKSLSDKIDGILKKIAAHIKG